MMKIHTVAAGEVSILSYDGQRCVGPHSAGADPLACYRRGGPLTVTDANVMLNRIQPSYFPKILAQSRSILDQAVVAKNFLKLQ